ncbi:MAG: hypothetical protein LBK67_06845 [Coriobacteriales bacterium]|nr:hypothetical protein [Coriobacteriales bacterium]
MHVCTRCGICKPPREPFLVCEECGAVNDPERGEFTVCKACGAELPPRMLPEPVFCQTIEQLCGNPCRQAERVPRTGKRVSCAYHTPVTTESCGDV